MNNITILDIIHPLINTGHIDALYKLLLAYKEIETILSQKDNLLSLFTINKLYKYYNFSYVTSFNYLYNLHISLNICKKVYNHIENNFLKKDFDIFKLSNPDFLGPYNKYEFFMNLQWYTLLQKTLDELKFIDHLLDVNFKYMAIEKENTIIIPMDSIIFDHAGEMYFTIPK